MSLTAFAKLAGVSQPAITKAIQSGRLTTLPDGTIDPDEGLRQWREVSPPDSRPSGVAGATRSPQESGVGHQASVARALVSSYKAKLLELEFKRRSGDLVERAAVEAMAFDTGRRVRERLMSIAARLAPVLASLSDTAECHELLEREMGEACDEMANMTFKREAQ